jgi:hypothetical protein
VVLLTAEPEKKSPTREVGAVLPSGTMMYFHLLQCHKKSNAVAAKYIEIVSARQGGECA